MFVSIYLPDSTITDAADVSAVTLQSDYLCRRWWASKSGHLSMIVALDANVELAPGLETASEATLTGAGLGAVACVRAQGTRERERKLEEDLRHVVESWMMEELKAGNTLATRQPTWYGHQRRARDRAR
eukprot:7622059-Pyramimonas_sp.AAC.1